MDWTEKIDVIEHAGELFNNRLITFDEFAFIKKQILQLTEVKPTSDFLKSDEWIEKTGKGETIPSNLGAVTGVVEKDSLLDQSEYNRLANKLGKFKDDFNRINNGDLPAADYY